MQVENERMDGGIGTMPQGTVRGILRPRIVVLLILLAGLTFASRWWLRCDYLLDWDTVQGAGAISHYDVALHIPHPPGEPVYVGLLRLLSPLVASPHHAVLLVACAADALAIVLLLLCAMVIGSFRTGLVAGLIFLVSPLAWHSTTLGTTFGVDVCLSSAIGFVAILLRRQPGDRMAILLAVLTALALGVRCNVNWASAALLPLAIYGLWRVGAAGRRKAAIAFAVVLAAWALPTLIWGASGPGYLAALLGHFNDASWRSSALGELLGGDSAGAVKSYLGASFEYAMAAAKSLGMAAIALPFLLIPLGRVGRDSVDRTPWGLLLIWVLPGLLLMAAGAYHAEEYVAVALPPLILFTAFGTFRAVHLTRSLVARFGLPRQAPVDRLERAFSITHILVFCGLNVLLFTAFLFTDPSGSRTLVGRRVSSAEVRIGRATHPRELLGPSIDTIARHSDNRQALILTKNRLQFLTYSLYLPDQVCLYVCDRDDGRAAVLARNHRFEFIELRGGEDVTIPHPIDLVMAAPRLGGAPLQVAESLIEIPLPPRDELTMGGMRLFPVGEGRIRLRHEESGCVLSLSEPAAPPALGRALPPDEVAGSGDQP